MITPLEVRNMALSFDGTEELPHFEIISFRVKKKIFATLNEKENRACLRFNSIDQSAFCAFDNTVIYPVPNAWGKYGWTLVNLKKVRKTMFRDAIQTAYQTVAPKKRTGSRKKIPQKKQA